MLKFSTLTLSQKRFVVAAIESNAQYKKNPQITLKECTDIFRAERTKRTGAKNEKIGYPNWLFNKCKVERGIYQLPVPTATELSDYQKELNAKLNPVKPQKVKAVKVAKVKAPKVKAVKTKAPTVNEDAEPQIEGSRLNKIIDESETYDQDVEDFNQILRENGIEV